MLGGEHWRLPYCGIKFSFVRYFGNFDFNVRYCGFADPCGIRFITVSVDGIRFSVLHGIAVSLLCPYCPERGPKALKNSFLIYNMMVNDCSQSL